MTDADEILFLRWLLVTVLAGGFLTVALVLLVDPYRLYGLVNVQGFNAVKPRLTRHQDEIKTMHAVNARADIVILGNSRAEIAFDPEASIFARIGATAYNLAVPGSAIGTARKQLDHLYAVGAGPKVVLIGLEFLDFVGMSPPQARQSTQSELGGSQHPVVRLAWRIDSLFSLASIKDSLRTLRIQRDHNAEVVTDRGFNPLNEYRSLARRDGYYLLFRQRAQENAKVYVQLARGEILVDRLNGLRAMLEAASQHGSNVTMIIYPYHAQILALLAETGMEPAFDEWKRRVLLEVKAVRRRYHSAQIRLMDFSGYGSYACERIPPKGDRIAETRWYWEAGHFKKALGDIVLDRLFSPSSNTNTEPADASYGTPRVPFGMLIESGTLELNRERIARERVECELAQPSLFADATKIIDDVQLNGHRGAE